MQDIEETRYWLELVIGADVVRLDRVLPLLDETDELTAILVTCAKRVKAKTRRPERKGQTI